MDRKSSLTLIVCVVLMRYRVAEFLPGFQDRVREALKVLLGDEGEKRVRMGLAKDGSGVGGQSYPSQISHGLTSSRFNRSTSQKGIG